MYAGSSTIVTSDGRLKQDVRELTAAERAVAMRCKALIRAYRFTDAVAAKGDSARIHFGIIAQDVKAAFEAEGLVAEDYGLLCFDEWQEEWDDLYEEIPAVYSESIRGVDGKPIEIVPAGRRLIREAGRRLVKPAGNRYGVRYEELLAFMIAVL